MLRRHRSVNFFAKISMHSLRDGDFMGQFVEFMADNPELAPRLVLEFSIDDLRDALGPRRAPLDRLSEMGFRFRSEERRVGKECVSTCRSRWAPYPSKKNKHKNYYKL